MTACYIIRHAEKEKGDYYNPNLRHQDEPISQKGQEQALKLWSYLCDRQMSTIYVSRYQRTGQIIEYVAKQPGITPVLDDRLNEIDNGCIEGLTDRVIEERYPDVWKAFHERVADFRFPEGNGRGSRASKCEFPRRKPTGPFYRKYCFGQP